MWEVTGSVCAQPGIVKATEKRALGDLLSTLSATSWSYVPATFPRLQEGTLLPQPQTLSLRTPCPPHLHRPVQKHPASKQQVHVGTGSSPTLSRGWA